MCIFEYNEEEALKYIRQDEREIGEEKGIQKAIIQMVCKKLRKGKSTDAIAEELEEDRGFIEEICRIAGRYAPEYDSELIYKEFSEQKF